MWAFWEFARLDGLIFERGSQNGPQKEHETQWRLTRIVVKT